MFLFVSPLCLLAIKQLEIDNKKSKTSKFGITSCIINLFIEELEEPEDLSMLFLDSVNVVDNKSYHNTPSYIKLVFLVDTIETHMHVTLYCS